MPPFRRSLDPLFFPSSVAVVGASATPGSVGSIIMRNLLENRFGGVVYPINPKRKAIHGVLCYPNLAAVPEADPDKPPPRLTLRGEVSSPIDPPPGCRLCGRCPRQLPICSEVEPKLVDVGGRLVACHAV